MEPWEEADEAQQHLSQLEGRRVEIWGTLWEALMSLTGIGPMPCGGQAAAGQTRGRQLRLHSAQAGAASPGSWGLLTHRPPLHREFRHKRNITFNDNDTVSFREYRRFQFQPDRSSGLESDYIVMPNILVLVRLPRARALHTCPCPWARGLGSLFLPALGTGQDRKGAPVAPGPDCQPSFPGVPTCLWFGGTGQGHCLSLFNLQIEYLQRRY